MTTSEEFFREFSWIDEFILIILYLNDRKLSKQKLKELFYFIYKDLKDKNFYGYLEFYISLNTKEILIFESSSEAELDDILYNLYSETDLIDIDIFADNSIIYLTDKGYDVVKVIVNDPKYKDDINLIMKIINQYKNLSEKELFALILEDLKCK